MSTHTVAIVIPTRDNRRYLEPCLRSILAHTRGVDYHVYVVNNGEPGSCAWIADTRVTVCSHAGGRGWVDGLIVGQHASDAPYLLLLNDDTLILPSDPLWLAMLARTAECAGVGAVGPSSNCVSGPQSIWRQDVPMLYVASYLIGFCMLVRRQALELAGGFDPNMGSADDLDLSYRLRRANSLLVGDRSLYVHHTGFVTGVRLHGDRNEYGGYNSQEWLERDRMLLVAKHGTGVLDYLSEPLILTPYALDRGDE